MFCHQGQIAKLFENDTISMAMKVAVQPKP
jgi:hypothetical protein